jgi:hypothetical protein
VFSDAWRAALLLHRRFWTKARRTTARRFEERAMSLSVSGTNANNPFAALQSLWQQASSANGAQGSSTSLSSLLAALGPQGGASLTSGTSLNGATDVTANAATPFGSQTLQALLALQANGGNQQSLASQFENEAGGTDPLSALQTQQSQGQHHHHHHHMGAGGSGTTDTASSGSSSSGASGSSGGAANGTGNNLIERLLQMQAQLVAPAATQSVTA